MRTSNWLGLFAASALTLAAGAARADLILDNDRGGLTFGGSLGAGHIECEGEGCDGVNGATGLELHVGTLLGPRLGVLADLWAMRHTEDRASFSQGMLTGALRFWPLQRLWIQGGVGLARASWEYDGDVVDLESRTDTVPAVMAGVGVELVSMRDLAVDLSFRVGSGAYDDDTKIRNASFALGVNWY